MLENFDSNGIKDHRLIRPFLVVAQLISSPIMPATRKIRSNILSDDFDEDFDFKDEFGTASADPFADPFEPIPDTPVSGKKKKSTRKSRKKSQLAALSSTFPCDATLPKKGIEIPNKVLLLNLLDAKGGPRSSSYESRVLDTICKSNVDELGAVGSERHKRVKWLVDRWKRDTDFATTRNNLMATFAALSPASKQIKKPVAATKQESQSKAPKRTEPEVKSPPPIARSTKAKKDCKMAPTPSISSPLRIFKLKNGGEKGMFTLNCFVGLIVDIFCFDLAL